MSVTVLAAAKINLSLDITGIRHDGYHFIEMILQSVDLFDTIVLSKATGISICCDINQLSGQNNLAYKAAELFFKRTLQTPAVEINIKKKIPVSSGLAGGSADAAAVLIGLNQLYSTELSEKELCKIGIELGADIPFCICGGTKFVDGIGEKISPLPNFPDCYFVIVKEGEKASTGEMYRQFDALKNIKHPQTQKLIDAIKGGNLIDSSDFCANVFELLWGENVKNIKNELLSFGALNAALSGSGPSVFGIFENKESAENCYENIKCSNRQVILCKPAHSGFFIEK